MISVEVNGIPVQVRTGSTVIQACESMGVEIPRFCYHERLLVAGNCRMCLVEIAGSPKPQAACALPVMPNMKVFTDSPLVKKARESVMEFLLLNHPLDCPICDQGGECDRQDQSMIYGSDRSRMFEVKRGVEDKDRGPLVKTVMTRCIHCTRCIRFASEVAGVGDRGTSGRGRETEVGTYVSKVRKTELSGNVIDLCPVGALTSKPTAFQVRPWERETVDTVDVIDAVGASVRAQVRGIERFRIQPRENDAINQRWIGDKTRFAGDALQVQRVGSSYVRNEDGLKATGVNEAMGHRSSHLGSGSPVDRVVSPARSAEQRAAAHRYAQFRASQSASVRCQVRGSGSPVSDEATASVEASARVGLNEVSEADRVVLVGFNPRREAPAINLRLRESVLRDRVQVVTMGRAIGSGETAHGLTYPAPSVGRTLEGITERREGVHPRTGMRLRAERPRMRVGPGVCSREDGAALRAMRQHRGSVVAAETGRSSPLRVIPDAANRVTVEARGWGSYTGRQASSARVRRGIDEGAFAEAGHPRPTVPSHAFRASVVSHGDGLVEASDVVLPLRAPYEENGRYVNLEGRMQVHRAAVTPAGARGGLAGRTSEGFSPRDVVTAGHRSVRGEVVRRPRLMGADRVPRPHSVGEASRVGAMATPVGPVIHDYYTEGHLLARLSRTMGASSQRLGVTENFLV